MTVKGLHGMRLVVLVAMALSGPGLALGASPPAAEAPASGATVPVAFAHLKARVPAAWTSQPPASSMRVAQFRVPAVPGSGDAELVVFYFGQGQGGSVDANIQRWTSQFSTPDGQSVTARIDRLRAAGMPVTTAELTGSYARNVGMGPGDSAKPNQTLLAAIVETSKGNVMIQLHGPRPTVGANREAFLAMLRGVK